MKDEHASSKNNTQSKELVTITQGKALGLLGSKTLSVPLPFESKIVLCESIRVAGTTHVPNISDIIEKMPDEAMFKFVREPNNEADTWAIKIEYEGQKIGYMPADKNEMLARLMDGGKTLQGTLLEYELQGNWWKIYFEVSLVD